MRGNKRRLLPRLATVNDARRNTVYNDILDMSIPRGSFYVMVAVSTTIAAYGLLSNSTAVVIGAMLVAPLMGPIFGIALGLSAGDRRMFKQAAVSESAGVVLAIGVGLLIGSLPLRAEFGQEIMARTQPTLYDIAVALASGLAGAYALMDERVSPALPGVAIATSLVPPLATCGLCLSAGLWQGAGGALLLFFANLLAIEIASAIIFLVYGMAGGQAAAAFAPMEFLKRFSVSLVLLMGVGIFMTRTLAQVIGERRLSDRVQVTLSGQFRSILGAQLSQFDLRRQDGAIRVIAVVLTPQQIEPELVSRIQEELRKAVDPRIELVVRSLISSDADSSGPVYLANSELERRARVEMETQQLADINRTLNRQLKSLGSARLVDVRWEQTDSGSRVTAVVRTPEAVTPPEVARMQEALDRALDRRTQLVVRSVIARDATADGFVDNWRGTGPLTSEEARLRARIDQALRSQLSRIAPGSVLDQFSFGRTQGRLYILAVAHTPRRLSASEVRRMQTQFRRHVDASTILVVRFSVSADVAGVGYLPSLNEDLFAHSSK